MRNSIDNPGIMSIATSPASHHGGRHQESSICVRIHEFVYGANTHAVCGANVDHPLSQAATKKGMS